MAKKRKPREEASPAHPTEDDIVNDVVDEVVPDNEEVTVIETDVEVVEVDAPLTPRKGNATVNVLVRLNGIQYTEQQGLDTVTNALERLNANVESIELLTS